MGDFFGDTVAGVVFNPGMPTLLLPSEKMESTTGFLWSRKRHLVFRTKAVTSDQVRGSGIGLARAVAAEYTGRKKIISIRIELTGSQEDSGELLNTFNEEFGSTPEIRSWLYREIPKFAIHAQTMDDHLIYETTYATVDGERKEHRISGSEFHDEWDNFDSVDLVFPRIKTKRFQEFVENPFASTNELYPSSGKRSAALMRIHSHMATIHFQCVPISQITQT